MSFVPQECGAGGTIMHMYRFLDTRLSKIAFSVFFFFLLCMSRCTMISCAIVGINTAQFIQLGLICILGVVFILVHRLRIKEILFDSRIIAFGLSTLVILLPMLVKRDWQMMYFSILFCLFTAIFFTYFISYKELAKYFVQVLAILSVYSFIATYAFKPLVTEGILDVPVINYGHNYYNFGLAFTWDRESDIRNYSIFREPGVFQFFIIVALFLNNYAVEWRKVVALWINNIILSGAMLTSFSTNGVVELALLWFLIFFDKAYYRNKYVLSIVLSCVLGCMIMIIHAVIQQKGVIFSILYRIFYKLFTASNSTLRRVESIYVDLMIFIHNPLFGEKIKSVMSAVVVNTSSTMILYAILGFVGGSLNVITWIVFVWEKSRKNWINISFVLIMLMAINTQNLVPDIFFWLFPMMALVERGLPLLQMKKMSE